MTNKSDLTRKQQVHEYLKTRINQWVDGTELANAQVGGSEGLKRLRELREELEFTSFEIQMRAHPTPGRNTFQYRLTQRSRRDPGSVTPPAAAPMQVPNRSLPAAERAPKRLNAPDRRGTHLAWDPDTQQYIAVYDGPLTDEGGIPQLPGQMDLGVPPAEAHKFTERPKGIALGTAILCPMCGGRRKAIKDPLTKQVRGYEEMTKDPKHPSRECPRCDGWGLIPTR